MLDEQAPALSIIIVSWNVRDLLAACLRSVVEGQGSGIGDQGPDVYDLSSGSRPPSTEVIVVDNASADGTADMVAAEFPAVRLIANSENRGFTAANNQGLAVARGRHVLFLNPDTVVLGDALPRMVSYMDAHPSVGALGPQLRYGDGSLQSSRRRFPSLMMALLESTPLAWHWPNNPWARRYRMDDVPLPTAGQAQEVDWLVGAALLVRREALAQVGGFDEGYFMYSEELDLCRRLRAAGWQIVYLPEAEIIHYEGKSSEQAVAARHIRFHTSKVRYFRKFHGPVVAQILRVFILAMFVIEWLLEAAKWLLGSRRPLRRARLAAYGQLLASGLGGW